MKRGDIHGWGGDWIVEDYSMNGARGGAKSEREEEARVGATIEASTSGAPYHPAMHFTTDTARVGITTVRHEYVSVFYSNRRARANLSNQSAVVANAIPKPRGWKELAGKWADDDLTAFVRKPSAPSIATIVKQLITLYDSYLELKHPEDRVLLAVWAVATWFHRKFSAFPRININGPIETGKSKILQLLKETTFNGQMLLIMTPATIFRMIESLRPTLLIDEVDNLSETDYQQINAILNAGYKMGGIVPRTEKDPDNGEWIVNAFDVYAPIALSGVEGLNSVLESRCITIITQAATDQTKMNFNFKPELPVYSELRAALYRAMLIRHVELDSVNIRWPSWLNGRARELFEALLTIATLAGVENDILKVAARSVTVSEPIADAGRMLFAALEQHFEKRGTVLPFVFIPSDLQKEYASLSVVKPEVIGRLLRRYGFEPTDTRNKRGKRYEVTWDEFVERARKASYPLVDGE